MQASQNIRLTLPSNIAEEFERVRKAEKRTPSDLVRKAVSSYLSFLRQFPEMPPTPGELRAIRHGRKAFARGEHTHLDDLLDKMGTGRNQTRRKKSGQASR